MEIPLLKDLIIILGVSVVVLIISHRFRIPSLIGFLITGILIGPNGFRLIAAIHEVEIMAEIGVILLLFTIGIEFSIKRLSRLGRNILMGGSTQVLLTIGFLFLMALLYGNASAESVFIGFLVALSSTAIVLKLLQSSAQIESPQGQNALAILIFQDIIIVPMILLTPLLAGNSANLWIALGELVLKGVVVILGVIVGARYVVPRILYQVARTQSRELFVLAIIFIAFSIAWLTSAIGLSLALGALAAGLILSESEYSEQAFGNVMPFLDLFTSFFFISVGMLFNPATLTESPLLILFLVIAIILLKTLAGGIATVLLGYPLRIAIMLGLSISQVGEFSFILAKIGLSNEILSTANYQIFLAVSVITMALTPLMIKHSPAIASLLLRLPWPEKLLHGVVVFKESEKDKLSNHLVIVGYGINGKNVARAARYANIPFRVLEMNAKVVVSEKEKGTPIFYGDAANEKVLEHAGISEALVLVITIADAVTIRKIIRTTRISNPHVHIIVRTRFVRDIQELYELGADEVIPEEFETSIEIFVRVLSKFLIPMDEIEKMVARIRSDTYSMFRSLSLGDVPAIPVTVNIPQIKINTIRVCKGSEAIGKELNELHLSSHDPFEVVAVSRASEVIPHPGHDFKLEKDDLVFLLGPQDLLKDLYALFSESSATEDLPQ